jgi:hypothetical protein
VVSDTTTGSDESRKDVAVIALAGQVAKRVVAAKAGYSEAQTGSRVDRGRREIEQRIDGIPVALNCIGTRSVHQQTIP